MRRAAAAAVAASCLAGVLSACGGSFSGAPAARAYLAAWSRGDDAAAGQRTDAPASATKQLTDVRHRLDVERIRTTLLSTGGGEEPSARFRASLQLRGLGEWTYVGRLQVRHVDGRWLVHWTASDLHPALHAGQRLDRQRTLPERAPLLDNSGQPLFTTTPTVTVGVEPARLGAAADTTYAALAAAVGIDPQRARKAAAAASPHAFVSLVTLRRSDYDRIRDRIHDLPGIVFQEGSEQLAASATFARAVLGQVGAPTKEVLAAAGDAYLASDHLGLYGLQAHYQRRLAGTPSGAVVVTGADGAVLQTLHRFTGRSGTPVRTTLDRQVQLAAERALDGVEKPAALVALRPSDGAVMAAANRPGDVAFDRAFAGRYPPGSTFKVVTTYALLGRGLHLDDPVPCPATTTVNGKAFRNFEGEARGTVPFRQDFAVSCNTAFVMLSKRLDAAALHDAGAELGLGGTWSLPLDTFTGSVPEANGDVERAADAIGQGKVLVSPLALATVAAAVQSGTWRSPVLVTDPAPSPGVQTHALDPTRVTALRDLMNAVVAEGTAAGAALPAGTAGKTGTAEFGSGDHPATHAWFIGYRDGLAFAVLVEGGGVGGEVAAPVAARFLRSVGS